MPLITISEDTNKGTFTLWDNDDRNYILSGRNDINFTDDQLCELLGEDEYNKLINNGKFDFKLSKKQLQNF